MRREFVENIPLNGRTLESQSYAGLQRTRATRIESTRTPGSSVYSLIGKRAVDGSYGPAKIRIENIVGRIELYMIEDVEGFKRRFQGEAIPKCGDTKTLYPSPIEDQGRLDLGVPVESPA